MPPGKASALVGDGRAIRRVRDYAVRVAPFPIPVSVYGETGTGKGECARRIHELSGRTGQFVEVSGQRLDSELAESELYGHGAEAFTGARHARIGRYAQADGGTFSLNELHRVPRRAHGLLLELLDGRPFQPIGEKRYVQPDVRLILSSPVLPRALKQLDRHLLFRFGSLAIEMPPLRERPDDVPLLVDHCIQRCSWAEALGDRRFSTEALALLCEFDWPGNVRQLFNIVESAIVLSDGPAIEADLTMEILTGELGRFAMDASKSAKQVAQEAVRRCGSQAKAARYLRVSEKTVSRRLRR